MHFKFVPPEPPDRPDPIETWKHMTRRQRILFAVVFVVATAATVFFWIYRR
jgi:flagellar biosynthesis/type III secretory pathway M-ring protein FliF/YscJ